RRAAQPSTPRRAAVNAIVVATRRVRRAGQTICGRIGAASNQTACREQDAAWPHVIKRMTLATLTILKFRSQGCGAVDGAYRPRIWDTMTGSVMLRSPARSSALLMMIESVVSPSNGR